MQATTLPYTQHDAQHPLTNVTLPCGVNLILHRLRSGDHYDCLERFSRLLQALAFRLGLVPTIDQVRDEMPLTLQAIYAYFDMTELPTGTLAPHRPGQESVTAFLRCFIEGELPPVAQPDDAVLAEEFGFTLDDLQALRGEGWHVPEVTVYDHFQPEDWQALWRAIWEHARYPFAFRRKTDLQNGELETAAALMKATTSPFSDAPASTPPTRPSKSNTRSHSRGGKPNGKRGNAPSTATGQA